MQRGNGDPLTKEQLQNGELLVEMSLQWTNGKTVLISPPFPVRRRSKFYGNRHLWSVTVPNLKRHLGASSEGWRPRDGDLGVASVTVKAVFNTFKVGHP